MPLTSTNPPGFRNRDLFIRNSWVELGSIFPFALIAHDGGNPLRWRADLDDTTGRAGPGGRATHVRAEHPENQEARHHRCRAPDLVRPKGFEPLTF